MNTNTTTVQALKEQIHRHGIMFYPLFFESDNVGSIDTGLTLPAIQSAIEEVCKYLGYSMAFNDQRLSREFLRVNFHTADPEQLYYALTMLVERGIINYNPATIDGLLFGTEPCQKWTDFGGRIYAGSETRNWSLSIHDRGMLGWQPYIF